MPVVGCCCIAFYLVKSLSSENFQIPFKKRFSENSDNFQTQKLKANKQSHIKSAMNRTVNASRLIETTRSLAFLSEEVKQNNQMMMTRSFFRSILIRGDVEFVSFIVERRKKVKTKTNEKAEVKFAIEKQSDTESFSHSVDI